MSDQRIRDFMEACQGMTPDEIIAAHHSAYYDDDQPYVRKAFEEMGIAAHEVADWVYRNIK